MRWYGAISLVALSVASVSAVFIDDAYQLDYHEALLGLPQPHTTLFHKPQPNSNASLLYTISDKAVLGAINPRDGSVIWRQALAGQPLEGAEHTHLVAGEGDGKVTTGFANKVAAWDASNGRLIWDHKLEEYAQVIGLEPAPVLGSSTDGAVQDIILLSRPVKQSAGCTVSRLAGDGSTVRWTHRDTSTSLDSLVSIATSPKHVFYITKSSGLLAGGKAKVAVLDIMTGKETKDQSIAVDSNGLGPGQQLVVGSGSSSPLLASSEKPFKTIKLSVLGNTKVCTLNLEDKGDEIEKLTIEYASLPEVDPHFLVHVQTASKHWAEVFHLNLKTAEAKKAYTLPATEETSAFAASVAGSKVYFTRITDSEVQVYSSESHGSLGRWPRNTLAAGSHLSYKPAHAVAEVVGRKGAEVAVRAALTSHDGNWYLVRNGDLQWIRPEMLAYATTATWSDDIDADPLVEELKTEVSFNPVSAYLHRLTRHAQELASLPQYLLALPQNILSPSSDSTSVRQTLIGSQSIVVATSKHQLIALDAANTGAIHWQTDLSSVASPDARSVHLSTDEGRVTIYLSDGSVIVANATTGAVIEHNQGRMPAYEMIELPGHPASSMIKVSKDGVPSVATDFAPSTPSEGNTVLTISAQGEALGWTIGSKVEKSWTLQPRDGAKFVNIAGRPTHDPIASIGKVLGNRSVLYKYVSPNLALLTAVSTNALTMYLIDAVTGSILHTATHQGVHTTSPIPSVLSENWFAYSFTSHGADAASNSKSLSTQLVIAELYESGVANERNSLADKSGNYSSFSADSFTPPHVIAQSYAIPEPISTLAVTQTAQGITTRQLIAYLPNSNAVAAIPRHVLDPRRPVGRDPTNFELEEGLSRYHPVLDLDPKFFLSHAREVVGIAELMSAPTQLESTSLVFGFGHDIFGTQVAPSMTFDVLGKTFNRVQLMLTVVALYIGVLAMRPLARSKIVERLWL